MPVFVAKTDRTVVTSCSVPKVTAAAAADATTVMMRQSIGHLSVVVVVVAPEENASLDCHSWQRRK